MKKMALMLAVWGIAFCGVRAETIPGLGTADFRTSTHSKEAQHEFLRGLLLLHVFEYPTAAKAFVAAQKLDPGFAMAYWGEAMTYNHPVWNQLDLKAGQAALAKFGATAEARASRIDDPRERAYMSALELLYTGNGTKRERDAKYATAMEQMSKAYPKDDEVQLFYALALLGQNEGVRDVPAYLKAAAISKAVFSRNPDHPGAAHYWIHGMDDPQHAAQALVPARALSKIAPDAGHAQHMCSHIFMALGMWDDVVKSNLDAIRVVDDQNRAVGKPVIDCGHYPIWLEYGYYQQGRMKDGDHVVSECERTAKEAAAALGEKASGNMGISMAAEDSLAEMRGIQLVETNHWSGPEELSKDAMVRPDDVFEAGYAASIRGDRAAAAAALSTLRGIAADKSKKSDADAQETKTLGILVQELGAEVLAAHGELDKAIAEARPGAETYAAMAFDFGPPVTMKPPHELLGELLLKAKKPAEAREAFATSLKFAPRRTASLLGLARAENAMGNTAGARAAYDELLQIWKAADAGYEPMTEARTFVSGKPSVAAVR